MRRVTADVRDRDAVAAALVGVSMIGRLAALLSEELGGPPPVVTGRYRLGDVRPITASSERAARELGWRAAVALADGVRTLL